MKWLVSAPSPNDKCSCSTGVILRHVVLQKKCKMTCRTSRAARLWVAVINFRYFFALSRQEYRSWNKITLAGKRGSTGTWCLRPDYDPDRGWKVTHGQVFSADKLVGHPREFPRSLSSVENKRTSDDSIMLLAVWRQWECTVTVIQSSPTG